MREALVAAAQTRIKAAESLLARAAGLVLMKTIIEAVSQAVTAVFGSGFVVVPRLLPAPAGEADLWSGAVGRVAFGVRPGRDIRPWLTRVGALRASTSAYGETLLVREAFGRRPLLRALEHPGPRPAVLLIDEIDRADDDFEAFLLELLADAAVTIPEIGTIRATHPPIIVLTSNRTRDLHDAVKRRCLYHHISYPTPHREVEIVRRRVKGASETLAVQVANAVSRMRTSDVQKPPGIAEAIDWLAALSLLGIDDLDAAAVDRTKYTDASLSNLDDAVATGEVVLAGSRATARDVKDVTKLVEKAVQQLKRLKQK